MTTAGPATDTAFTAAARRLRDEAIELDGIAVRWPSVDPALYGATAASSTSADRLLAARRRVRSAIDGIGQLASECDVYAQGCREYYEAYRRYIEQRTAYENAWAAYHAACVARAAGSAVPRGLNGAIVLGPPVPAAATTAGPPVPSVLVDPEPPPPSIVAPNEPPCPPYCDPAPVR